MFYKSCEKVRPRWFGRTYDMINRRIYTVYTVCLKKNFFNIPLNLELNKLVLMDKLIKNSVLKE